MRQTFSLEIKSGSEELKQQQLPGITHGRSWHPENQEDNPRIEAIQLEGVESFQKSADGNGPDRAPC